MATVRDAVPDDAAACAAVYAPYVLGTAVTFEETPPTAQEMAERIGAAQRTHAWVVLVDEGTVTGYAYGTTFRTRPAYRWTCEVSAYLAPGRAGRGGGRALYEVLLPRLAGLGYRTVVAGMVPPNPGSEALHRAFGFEPVGTFHRVGHKLGKWHDVAWVQRTLADDDAPVVEVPPTR